MESFRGHLTVYQSQVRAGREISPIAAGWSFSRICAGTGYLLHGHEVSEVGAGDVVVLAAGAKVRWRASLIGDLRLCCFDVCTERLTGFFTAREQQALNAAALSGACLCRVIKREEAAALQHAALCELPEQELGALVRSAMLSLAVNILRDILAASAAVSPRARGPEQKFLGLIARFPESELLSRPVGDWVRECGCTERHFRRLYAGCFGVSLKRRQIEWRIEQARKLLVETDAKVIEISSQCGFQSLGQFNVTFKRLTRMTPSAWRKIQAAADARHRRQHPPRCPRRGSHCSRPAE